MRPFRLARIATLIGIFVFMGCDSVLGDQNPAPVIQQLSICSNYAPFTGCQTFSRDSAIHIEAKIFDDASTLKGTFSVDDKLTAERYYQYAFSVRVLDGEAAFGTVLWLRDATIPTGTHDFTLHLDDGSKQTESSVDFTMIE